MGLCSPSSGTYVIIFLGASKKKVLRKTAVNPPKPEFFSNFDPETSKQLDSSLNRFKIGTSTYHTNFVKFGPLSSHFLGILVSGRKVKTAENLRLLSGEVWIFELDR